MSRPSPATARWLILAALLLFWEVFPRTGIIPELFLPSLSKVVAVLVNDWREYASELSVTLYEVALSMLIACGIGIIATCWAVLEPPRSSRGGIPKYSR